MNPKDVREKVLKIAETVTAHKDGTFTAYNPLGEPPEFRLDNKIVEVLDCDIEVHELKEEEGYEVVVFSINPEGSNPNRASGLKWIKIPEDPADA